MNLSTRATALLATAVLFAATLAPALHAQGYSGRYATAGLTVGADFAGGASLIVQPPDGQKLGPIFAWRAGVDATYPLTPVISAGLGLGIDSRGTELRDIDNSEHYRITRVSYFTITPSFNFNAFSIGLNMGIPMGGSNTTKLGLLATEVTSDMSSDEFDRVEFMLEPRIGTSVVLLDDDNGALTMTLSGGYTLSTLQDLGNAASLDAFGDYHMASLHLGLSYQLAIPHTRRK
jgi:hypothetical protein